MSKVQRQHRLSVLLGEHPVTSQPQLVELLAADGFTATQATVSRDLEELGAVKVRVPGGESVYAIPELPADHFAPRGQLERVMAEWVVDIVSSANLVVLRTPPGSAHVVASALDRTGLPDVAGTVGGDDTILVVAAEGTSGADLAGNLRTLAGL
ncbi:MAG: Arginine repressor [Acidimicrobiaceae bacterium]|nr:Arginine repressor [Acidimicrobiaceae bacterium]